MISHRVIPQTEAFIDAKLKLYNALNSIYMQPCKYPHRIKDGYLGGRVRNFGEGDRRPNHGGYGEFIANKKFPLAWKLLKEYAKFIVPDDFTYSMITVNKNVCMKKHLDGKNAGLSYLTCLGDFEGGGLYVYSPEKNLYQTKDCVVSFNGSELPHESEPFNGSRFTLVFFSQYQKNKMVDAYDKSCSSEQPLAALSAGDELEELVQLSLRWGVIDEHVDKLGWSVSKMLD